MGGCMGVVIKSPTLVPPVLELSVMMNEVVMNEDIMPLWDFMHNDEMNAHVIVDGDER